VNIVDEIHVIEAWKKEFRKDYGELKTIKIIAGTEIPWAGFSATLPTLTFEDIYISLGFGENRPFWGIDLGAD
jgi:superfamily II DNA helicase RecQ